MPATEWRTRFHQRVIRTGPRPAVLAVLALVMLAASPALAGVVRRHIGTGAVALLRNGRTLYLECHPPPGEAKEFFEQYLIDKDLWEIYANKGAVAVPSNLVLPEVRRRMLLSLFPLDVIDHRGWVHNVQYAGGELGQENLWNLCEWLTGRGTTMDDVLAVNGLTEPNLTRGQSILVPREFLLDAMRDPYPPPIEEVFEDLDVVTSELEYGEDEEGAYAIYTLKPGESLYSAVSVRFTDFHDNADILNVCRVVQRRSGIDDVRNMEPGQKVLIPVDLLSARYKPRESPERMQYEEVVREAQRLEGQVRTRDLAGVVVVLDPGHGGRDHGAHVPGTDLYEDRINYDIACRIKRILKTETSAKVYMTITDLTNGFSIRDITSFTHTTDQELLTTPRYANTDARVSANLRAYLANDIFDREVKKGTDPRKIVFTSIHCDFLYNERIRGAMVYIPGAAYRRAEETPRGAIYDRLAESRVRRTFRTTPAESRRDEALSRNFATTLLDQLGKHRIKRHDSGDPIRNVIRQSGGREYLPAVLRANKIPTKVLVETANLRNPIDQTRVADPWWRQQFAVAYVAALREFYGF